MGLPAAFATFAGMIYHLALPEEWEAGMNKGQYAPGPYAEEGFIHCSTEAQVLPTANFIFTTQEKLVVLHLVEKRLDDLRWEAGPDGQEFPHVYHKIPVEIVESLTLLTRDEDGKWVWEK